MYTDEKKRMKARIQSESLIICDGCLNMLYGENDGKIGGGDRI